MGQDFAFAFASGERTAPVDTGRDFALGRDGYTFSDLFRPPRLAALDADFRRELAAADPDLGARFEAYRAGATLAPPEDSELLIAVARHLSAFVAALFKVEEGRRRLLYRGASEQLVFRLKEFIARRAIKKYGPGAIPADEAPALRQAVRTQAMVDDAWGAGELARRSPVAGGFGDPPRVPMTIDLELALAEACCGLLDQEKAAAGAPSPELKAALDLYERWAAVHHHDPVAHQAVAEWVSFRFPHKVDHHDLVPLRRPRPDLPNLTTGLAGHHRRRDGFGLTDGRASPREVASEVDYCLYCHNRLKDSCSHGLREKDGTLKKNPIGVTLAGCPLDERISEMHILRKEGDSLGALALVAIDNPMLPGTGHRICNDCMKGCIFQKQEPVNIPQVETGVLTDVLDLPFGFEIYTLLTRWNPLNRARPFTLPYNGKNVLVVGLGPAGYTLAHHLLGEGFGVVAVDGLKIEPLPADLVGADAWPPRPVERWSALATELDRRVLVGFGGVAEYGITVRWDKNFLTGLHVALARRSTFRAYGGVRFGGTLDAEQAFGMGFHHIAVAAGAGKPTIIDLDHNLINGVRKASDFLMALQLTGAFKRDSLANLQVRLPAVVIGGGLTGIDTTTELAAYYPVQVEKFLQRWEMLCADPQVGEEALWRLLDVEEAEVAREFLAHGRAVRAERERAAAAAEAPDLAALVNGWGGVSLVYRKSMHDSPAYRLNHEEIVKFLEEGVTFVENLAPIACEPDERGALAAVVLDKVVEADGKWRPSGERVRLPARTLLVAAGTSPNITYERERPGTFAMDPRARAFRGHRAVRQPDGSFVLEPATGETPGFFTSYARDGRFITYYGDNHPVYAGSVVKAMASAKHGYPHVAALFADETARLRAEDQPARDAAWEALLGRLDDELRPTVHEVRRLTPTIVEVVVRAPAAARNFHPGQFFRLQNYESLAATLGGSRLQMEGLALTGAWVDRARGLLSLIVLEMGGSSRLCARLRPGEPVVVMGPTGAPTEIPRGEAVALCGGGLGNAVLFSIARAMREGGCRVLYFAAYRRKEDIYKVEEIEAATDQVIWSVDAGELPVLRRPQDRTFRGNVVQAMLAHARGELGEPVVPLAACSRIIAIGSDRMMAAVTRARHAELRPHLREGHAAIASINSPMQCMMKEVCAQCLQKQVDPVTGKQTVVFTCSNQDQCQDAVDWRNLAERLRQNSVQEKLTDLWVRRLLAAEAAA
jgi:NADPH-dependent glutamate synthase beta subunit-like oxidoreductase/NAD(P)H-flavin reductase